MNKRGRFGSILCNVFYVISFGFWFFAGSMLLDANVAWGDGCDSSMHGHNEPWETYDAGGTTMEVRTCLDKDIHRSFFDVRNLHEYTVCFRPVATTDTSKPWTDRILMEPGKNLYWSSPNPQEVWRASAKRAKDRWHCE